MPKKKSSSLLSSYRKKQQSSKTLIFVLAGVLILAGLALIALWATGNLGGSAWSVFASPTPTATATLPPTPVPPTQKPSATATLAPTPTITLTPTQSGPSEYKVQEGDSCYTIAEKFNVEMEMIRILNALDIACSLNIGQVILIPAPWQQMPTATPLPTDIKPGTVIDYLAEPGASFKSIAQFFNSSITRIVQESNKYRQSQGLTLWTEASQLQIGDLVKVPVNIVTPTPTNTATRTSTPLGAHLTPQATATTKP